MCVLVSVQQANGEWVVADTKAELAAALGVPSSALVNGGDAAVRWEDGDCLCPLDEKATAKKLGLKLQRGYTTRAKFVGDYAFKQPNS